MREGGPVYGDGHLGGWHGGGVRWMTGGNEVGGEGSVERRGMEGGKVERR